jgi:hypothetical protein
MTTRRVAFRQCDVTRAIKAARAAGAARVVVRHDGSIAIEIVDASLELDRPFDDWTAPRRRREIVL